MIVYHGSNTKEIKVYPEYDQIAFISQKSIDKLLAFRTASEVLI